MIKVWNPTLFQGNTNKKRYFEGWYYKCVTADGSARFSLIPGISLGTDSHSFIQFIDGETGVTSYFRYPVEEFTAEDTPFRVRVGTSEFTETGFKLDINNNTVSITGSASFGPLTTFPVSLLTPGIMGYFRYLPFMECYHGVVSLDHGLTGEVRAATRTYNLDGGRGYIEKDWGTSMPSSWIWMQSNTFKESRNASFMLSAARIPFLGMTFTGFLGYLLVNGKLTRFGTWTGARLSITETGEDSVRLVVSGRNFFRKWKVEIDALKGKRGDLLAPVEGNMTRTIRESLDARLSLRFLDARNHVLWEDKTINAGLELVGSLGLHSQQQKEKPNAHTAFGH